MTDTNGTTRARRALPLLAVGVLLLLAAGLVMLGRAADHRDGPIFGPPGITITNSRRDINDVYIFTSPANAANTVMIMTLSPFAGATTPATFDQSNIFDFKISNRNLTTTEDITFRVTFGAPDSNGVQDVTLRALPASRFPPTGILARGKTGANIPVQGGGMFRASIQDDPFFFDAVAFNNLLNHATAVAGVTDATNPYPRPVGTAANFFGPNVNTLAIILEIPSARILGPASGPDNGGGTLVGYWGRSEQNGVQIDRMGRPAINTALIPQIPRGSHFPLVAANDIRNAFNAGRPKDDRANFTAAMKGVLTNFYPLGQPGQPFTIDQIASVLLPDILVFQPGNTNGFGTFVGGGAFLGNGRTLHDSVIHVELSLLTGGNGSPGSGAVSSDNVNDDNGLLVTDGSVDPVSGMTRPILFPYIGAPHMPGTPLPGPQPPP
jgi:hypothetical protein